MAFPSHCPCVIPFLFHLLSLLSFSFTLQQPSWAHGLSSVKRLAKGTVFVSISTSVACNLANDVVSILTNSSDLLFCPFLLALAPSGLLLPSLACLCPLWLAYIFSSLLSLPLSPSPSCFLLLLLSHTCCRDCWAEEWDLYVEMVHKGGENKSRGLDKPKNY